MSAQEKRKPGRPPKKGGHKNENFPVYAPFELKEEWGKYATQRGISMSAAALEVIEERLSEVRDGYSEVNVLGYIPASPAAPVVDLPPNTTVRPPFRLGKDCYGLIVTGDSMTQADGLSIPDGSYAFFCPDILPYYGAIVHVEWPENEDGGEHFVTLKKYCPQADGETVYFEPLNKDEFDRIVKHKGEFVIRGVFSHAWDGKSKNEQEG